MERVLQYSSRLQFEGEQTPPLYLHRQVVISLLPTTMPASKGEGEEPLSPPFNAHLPVSRFPFKCTIAVAMVSFV